MKLFHFCTFYLCIVLFSCTDPSRDTKPNILFIFADDLTYEAIGGLGHPIVNTPYIDRLIQSGTSFTHAYNMGGWNGAVCVASRAMLISGRHLWRAKEMDKRWRQNEESALNQTWPRLMESVGYDTYMTGKWHVQAKANQIFQTAKNIRPGMPKDLFPYQKVREYVKNDKYDKSAWADIMPPGYNRPLSVSDQSWSPLDTSFGGFWEGGKHWSEVVADDALDFLDASIASPNPFFMYIAFNAPHDPRQAPQQYLDMYPLDEIAVPDNFLPEYPFKDSIGCSHTLRDEALAPFPRTPLAVKTHLQEYYAIITHLDHQIGRILDALESMDKAENTYIIFTADHGLSVGHHGLLGKQNLYDHSMRVPFVISGPDVPKYQLKNSAIYLQDVMPTSLELAGVAVPNYVDFKSLVNNLKSNGKSAKRDAILGFYTHDQRMIQMNNFKLMVYPKASKMRLFNMVDDPQEMNDLIDTDAHKAIAKSLFLELKKRMEAMNDPVTLEGIESFLER